MSTITKEWLQQAINDYESVRDELTFGLDEYQGNILAALRIALASLEAEAVAWISERNLKNLGKSYSVYVKHEPVMVRPIPLYTAPPAPVSVPDFGALTKCIVQRLVDYGAADDDAIARAEEFVYNACRDAMLQGAEKAESATTMQTAPALDSSPKTAESTSGINQGKSEPVTTAYKLPFDQWLSQQTGTIDVECGCVMTEVFFHWLRVAYEAGNSPHCREILNSSTNNCRESAETSTKCWCHTCRPVTISDMRFVVCPECGNKRCPHANDHRNACTGSNEPGQEGGAYPAAPQQEISHAIAKGMERYGDAMQELAKKEVK